MNDLETLLSDHLHTKAAALAVDSRLTAVHGSRPPTSRRRRTFVARPAWLSVAAGFVAAGGVGAFVVNRATTESTPPSPTVPPGALPVTPGPTTNDHWHEAYAFWLCGRWVTLHGALEDTGSPGNQAYVASGIHSHDDGVIHIHPFTSAGSGDNATLGTFLAGYGVELTDDSLAFPPGQRAGEVPMTCDDEPAVLRVTVWPDAAEPNVLHVYTGDLTDIPLRDGAAMTIAVAPPGVSAPMPPAAADLESLGAIDSGGAAVADD